MASRIYQEHTVARAILVAVVLLGIGVALMYGSEEIPAEWRISRLVIANVGGLLVGSVGLSLLWELHVKRAFMDEIFDVSKIAQDVKGAKIIGVTTDFMNGVEWVKHIDACKEMDIMFAGGDTWRNAFSLNLNNMTRRPGVRINLFLPDPLDDGVIEDLVRRFGYTEGKVKSRIFDVEVFFKDLAAKSSSPRASAHL